MKGDNFTDDLPVPGCLDGWPAGTTCWGPWHSWWKDGKGYAARCPQAPTRRQQEDGRVSDILSQELE